MRTDMQSCTVSYLKHLKVVIDTRIRNQTIEGKHILFTET